VEYVLDIRWPTYSTSSRPNSVFSGLAVTYPSEKCLNVLDIPLPETEKALLQFIGLVNYFRDHVPYMMEMVQPLQGFQEVDLDIRECRRISLQSDRCIQLSRALLLRGLCNRLMHLIMVSGATCTLWQMDKSTSFVSSANPSLDHSWIGRHAKKNAMRYTMA